MTKQAWSVNDFLFRKKKLCRTVHNDSWVIASRQDSCILPTGVASHSAGFGWPCLLMEQAIYNVLTPPLEILFWVLAVSFCFVGELAYHGHRVKVYDRSRQALEKASNVLEEHKKQLRREECMINRDFVVRLIQQYHSCYNNWLVNMAVSAKHRLQTTSTLS